MSLFANVRVTTTADHSVSVGWLDIQRQEALDLSDKDAIADTVCTYTVRIDGEERATVLHRYGDGAWVLLRRAIQAAVELPTETVDQHEPAPDDPDGTLGPAYFVDLIRRFGRCACPPAETLAADPDCREDECTLCAHLDVDWPCPSSEHRGYEQSTAAASEEGR